MAALPTPSVHSHAPRPRRAVLITSAVVLGAFGAVYATSHATGTETPVAPATPPPPKVTVAPVEQRVVTQYEEITGHVDAAETVNLHARVSGQLASVRFQAGQLVHKGDVLFTLDPRPFADQVALAAARVDQARASADVATREAARAASLLAGAAISSEEAEARRSRALEARAALAAAEAELASAKLDLDFTQVRAPIDGRVSRALVTAGNLVSGTPGSATLLTTIVTVGDAYVYADLDESAVLRFEQLAREHRLPTENGRIPVDLQLADDDGYPRHGYIESTDNRLNPDTGSLMLRMVFPNGDGALLPGLFARVRVPVSAPQPALLVSDRAIGTDQGQNFVFALEKNNTVAYRTVALGPDYDGKRVVTSGLHPGDRIVVNGLQRVRPGMTVTPEPAAVAATTTAATQVALR